MSADRAPITEAELRWAYRMTRYEARGIDFDQAVATPCLRACLELGVVIRRRRRARSVHPNAGAGIERSQPEFSKSRSNTSCSNHSSNP